MKLENETGYEKFILDQFTISYSVDSGSEMPSLLFQHIKVEEALRYFILGTFA